MTFETDLRALINRYSKENGSNTPDFILAEYLSGCLIAYNAALTARDKWFAFKPWGGPEAMPSPPHPEVQK